MITPNINKTVKEAVKIAKDNSHGYDQLTRTSGVDYDCSSLIAHCLIAGGFNVDKNSTTRTLYSQLVRLGFKDVTGEPLKKGDILLTPGKHTVIASTAKKVVTASINEKGTATGGKKGDQTGREIYIRDYYKPSYGWTYHLRYFKNVSRETSLKDDKYYKIACDVINGKYGNGAKRKIKLGAKYKAVQKLVNNILKNGGLK